MDDINRINIKELDEKFQRYERPEAMEFITKPPHWLVHSGMTILFISISGVLAFSHFFRYPEKQVGRGIFTADIPPVQVVSKGSGYIEEILVPHEGHVEKGQPMARIHHTAEQSHVDSLRLWLNALVNSDSLEGFLVYNPPLRQLALGELQQNYNTLLLTYEDWHRKYHNKIYLTQLQNIDQEYNSLKVLNTTIVKEKKIYAKEIALSKKDALRNQSLYKDGVVSARESEITERALLSQERFYASIQNGIIQNEVRMNQLQYQKTEIIKNRNNELNEICSEINAIASQLQSQLISWNETYFICAPASGQVFWQANQTKYNPINPNATQAHILPSDHHMRYIRTTLPTSNFGKVVIGQKVIIKMDAYPYKEYGILTAKVDAISSIPIQDQEGHTYYEIMIYIPENLSTDFRNTIPYHPLMPCTVEIITKDMSLLQRIIFRLTSINK